MKSKINLFISIAPLFCAALLATGCGKKSGSGVVQPAPGTGGGTTTTAVKTDVSEWLTTADQSQLLAKQNLSLMFGSTTNSNTTIAVDTTTQYQSIDGFGFALTGGSASLINSLSSTQKSSLLHELFATDNTGIGISYLRISIGASDLSANDFTYDDVSGTDPNLASFSIAPEQTDLIPVLKAILAVNPSIKIIATPWTAPVWMKQNTIGNNGFEGGNLNPAYYDVYAKYFVRYLQAMAAQGIPVDAITPQNEPLNAYNNPSMTMQATEEGVFVKNNLGPQLKAAGLSTKIIVYDHNADNVNYAQTIFADAAARQYIDGSAFHLYNGDISALNAVHAAYPAKNLYFTEQYTASTGSFSGDSYHGM